VFPYQNPVLKWTNKFTEPIQPAAASYRVSKQKSNNFQDTYNSDIYVIIMYAKLLQEEESRYRPGVAQRVPGGLSSQISMTFGTWRWWGCQPHAPAIFTPSKCSWYSFSLGAESSPGPWYGRKEYVTEKSSDTTGNRSRDRPTSSAALKPLRHPRPQNYYRLCQK
jgi:hypothetical protein